MNKSASMAILTLSVALSACGPGGTEVQALPGEKADVGTATEAQYNRAREQVADDIAALSELELFDVDRMLMTAGTMPGTCYGPCQDEDRRMALYIAQAERLQAFVDAAEGADVGDPCYTRASDVIDQSLAALGELELVGVGQMIVTEPENNPMCYNLPCSEDIEAADVANEERATTIWRLAQSTVEL